MPNHTFRDLMLACAAKIFNFLYWEFQMLAHFLRLLWSSRLWSLLPQVLFPNIRIIVAENVKLLLIRSSKISRLEAGILACKPPSAWVFPLYSKRSGDPLAAPTFYLLPPEVDHWLECIGILIYIYIYVYGMFEHSYYISIKKKREQSLVELAELEKKCLR